MKISQIMFQPFLAAANVAGLKSQTRREWELKILNDNPDNWVYDGMEGHYACFHSQDGQSWRKIACRVGGLGDILWQREAYKPKRFAGQILEGCDYLGDHLKWLESQGQKYTSGSGCETGEKWTGAIHMPKAACRHWMKTLEVYPQRLLDITEEDAVAEGVEDLTDGKGLSFKSYIPTIAHPLTAKASFLTLIHKLHNKPGQPDIVERNPWFWRIRYEGCGMPEGFL